MSTTINNRRLVLRAVVSCFALILIQVMIAGCSSDDQVKPLKPLRVATGNWEPFVGEHLPHHGPLAEMVSTVLVDLGYVPEFKFYDWPMVEIHLKTGYPGLAFPFIKSAERTQKGFYFSRPLYTFDYVLFYHKDREQEFRSIQSLEELAVRGLKIGLIRGYAKLSDIHDKDNYVDVPSAAAGFQMLRRSRDGGGGDGNKIDFLLESRAVGLKVLEGRDVAQDRDQFMYLGQNGRDGLISKVSLGLMLSPKLDESFRVEINKSIVKNKEFFDSLRARIGSHPQDVAFLSSPTGKAIYGYADKLGDGKSFLIPGDSRVLVTEWGEAYMAKVNGKDMGQDAGRSRVKLLNGPLKGKLVWVNNKYLTLER